MPFEKNNTLGGRKAGSLNKATSQVKDAFNLLLENNLDRLQADIDELEPLHRLKIILELSQYVVPRLKSVEVQADINQDNHDDLINKLMAIPEDNFNQILKDK